MYRGLAERVLAQTEPDGDEYARLVFFAPADARDEITRWLPSETLVAQRGEDLGRRMEAAFGDAFARGAERVALIGTDVPRLSRALVIEALSALGSRPVALGPATDGGYYLVALRERRPELFRGIEWGSGSVLAATLERCAALGLPVHLLPPWPTSTGPPTSVTPE